MGLSGKTGACRWPAAPLPPSAAWAAAGIHGAGGHCGVLGCEVPHSDGVPRLGGEVPHSGGVSRLGGGVPHSGSVPPGGGVPHSGSVPPGGGVSHSGSVPLGGGVPHCCSVPPRGGVPHGGGVPLGSKVQHSGGVPNGKGSGPRGTRVGLYKGPAPSLRLTSPVSLSLPRGGVVPCDGGGVLPGGLVPRSSGGTPCIGSDVPQGGVVVVGLGHDAVVKSMYALYARESMYVLLVRVVVESMYVSSARVVVESMYMLLGHDAVVESMYTASRGWWSPWWFAESAMPFGLVVFSWEVAFLLEPSVSTSRWSGWSRSLRRLHIYVFCDIAHGVQRRKSVRRARTCRARRGAARRGEVTGPVTCRGW